MDAFGRITTILGCQRPMMKILDWGSPFHFRGSRNQELDPSGWFPSFGLDKGRRSPAPTPKNIYIYIYKSACHLVFLSANKRGTEGPDISSCPSHLTEDVKPTQRPYPRGMLRAHRRGELQDLRQDEMAEWEWMCA